MPLPEEHSPSSRPLGPGEADELARRMAVFATGSRLRIVYALGRGECSVEELAERAGLGSNAASQQLRVLRDAGLVVARRDGRHVHYRLHDHHVLDVLGAMRHHIEHVRHGWHDAVEGRTDAAGSRSR
ncbi:MAG: ArsR/SmtB family transcription factor [Solirubrobacteraceae bacterium]